MAKICQPATIVYLYVYAPRRQIVFMGNEFGQTTEWNYKSELNWNLLQFESHLGMKYCVQKLNELYSSQPALYEKQFETGGFEWVDLNNATKL